MNIYNTYDNVIKVFPAVYDVQENSESDREQIQTIPIFPSGVRVKIKTELSGKQVFLRGSWDKWTS
jgi:hypothetical protein